MGSSSAGAGCKAETEYEQGIREEPKPPHRLAPTGGMDNLRKQADMTQRTCTIDGCDKKHWARGYCASHYQTARASGMGTAPITSHYLSDSDTDALLATCALCGPESPITVLSRGPVCSKKLAEANAHKAAQRKAETPERRARRNEYHRNYNRAQRYSLRIAVGVVDLLEAAEWQCEICGEPLTIETSKIDHDHSCCPRRPTCGGCIRGVLCNRCNTGIGFLQDNPDLLQTAADYIRSHGAGH